MRIRRPASHNFNPILTASICVTYVFAVTTSSSPGSRTTGSATASFFVTSFLPRCLVMAFLTMLNCLGKRMDRCKIQSLMFEHIRFQPSKQSQSHNGGNRQLYSKDHGISKDKRVAKGVNHCIDIVFSLVVDCEHVDGGTKQDQR